MEAVLEIKQPRAGTFWRSFLFLCVMLFLTSCEGNKTIVNHLDQSEANEILVFLASNKISAEKVKSAEAGGGGVSKGVFWDIIVKTTDANEAMRLLNQQGLPRRPGKNVLDIFSTGGLVSSDLQEKIKYRAALAEQLASTIRKYDGILDSDVQVSFPEEDPLNPGKMRGKITASVWVKHSGVLDDPNSHLATKIKRFVSSSITGLNYDDVTVIGERSRLGDVNVDSIGAHEEEKSYVNVWGVVISKDSLSLFRWIFFTFSLLLLLTALTLVWLMWKLWPVLIRHGGFKSLFSIKSLDDKEKSTEMTSPTAKKPPVTKEEAQDEEEKGDRDIDET